MTWWYAYEETSGKQRNRNAGSKARQDINAILGEMDICRLEVFDNPAKSYSNPIDKVKRHKEVANRWHECVDLLEDHDGLILQVPCLNHSIYIDTVLKKIKSKHVKLIILIHDLESFRLVLDSDSSIFAKYRIRKEESPLLNSADIIISHNRSMTDILVDKYNINREKIVDLGIFDYLCDSNINNNTNQNGSIVIAGNLMPSKAGYIYNLPRNTHFNLYGFGIDTNRIKESGTLAYCGSFPPNELPGKLEGSFGLVWDGPTSKTCEGTYGNYLTINSPHKTSLYLTSGIPVIYWNKCAIGHFITENNVGIAIPSLDDINHVIANISNDYYSVLKQNCIELSSKVRSGFFTRLAIQKSIERIS